MGKYKWQGLAFLLLIFILSLGLSYLAFNENSIDRVETQEQVMSIALVNEDEGAVFNDERIVFGDEFANSINKDSNHEWYVVSRGVAESGYNRGSYDMVIIIPNDFSERSLSIHLEKPEPVTLQYKINATGHENVRAEAEKTAGNILNEFNKRLIDVYFASIIGNLQEAQDNISEIIDKEKQYTNEYRENIYSPLADYTNQFQTVQDYTEISKDSYRGLEDILESFQSHLAEEVENNKAFQTELQSVIRLKEEESTITRNFSDFLDLFTSRMSASEVMGRLAVLEHENDLVQQQFHKPQDGTRTIASRASFIETRFEQLVNDIHQFQKELEKKLHTELEEVVRNNLEVDFHESIEPAINELFYSLDDNILEDVKANIEDLPSLNPEDIIDAGLEGETLRDILNVIEVTNKFIEEAEDYNPTIRDQSKLLSEKIKDIKRNLARDGITVTDTVRLPEYEDGEQVLAVSVPEEYRLDEVILKFSDDQEVNYGSNNRIELTNPPAGPLTLTAKLRLIDSNAEIDVFAPMKWTWAVSQEGMEETEEDEQEREKESNASNANGNSGNGKENNDNNKEENLPDGENDDKDETEQNDEDEPTNEENNVSENENSGHTHILVEEEEIEEQIDEDEESGEENGDEDGGGNESENPVDPPEEPEPTPPIESETIIKTNNYLVQKVLSSLVSNPKDELVEAAAIMVNDYYQLFSLYELYYGFDMSAEDLPDIIDGTLGEAASTTSLYFFIHEKEINDILEDHIVNKITESVTKDIQTSMEILEENVEAYVGLVESTSNVSSSLVETITETSEHAKKLNEALAATLEELSNWRETSQQLVEDKTVVLDQNQEVQTAVMALDTNYQPLLLASESLAEQARSNFDVANNVYDTFEAIDQQASLIQESGTNIVRQATDLANQLTEKALADGAFAENFNEVLANSRVGDRPNENLYRFLANPVQTKNTGIITEGESFTAYFIVIILMIVTLFTAYVISTLHVRNKQQDVFEGDQTLIQSNQSITIITSIVGAVEGIVIGLISFYLLQLPFENMFTWVAVILFLTMAMLYVATYLLRQLKMTGMFILLALLSLYLLLTRTLGFQFENTTVVELLRTISPLQQVEALLSNMIESNVMPSIFTFILLVVLTAIGLVINLFVIQKNNVKEEIVDEKQAEAN